MVRREPSSHFSIKSPRTWNNVRRSLGFSIARFEGNQILGICLGIVVGYIYRRWWHGVLVEQTNGRVIKHVLGGIPQFRSQGVLWIRRRKVWDSLVRQVHIVAYSRTLPTAVFSNHHSTSHHVLDPILVRHCVDSISRVRRISSWSEFSYCNDEARKVAKWIETMRYEIALWHYMRPQHLFVSAYQSTRLCHTWLHSSRKRSGWSPAA